MSKQPTSPEMYEILPTAPDLSGFVRRYLHADLDYCVNTYIRPAATGFGYMGHTFRGKTPCVIDGVKTSSASGFLIACQVDSRDIRIEYEGRLGSLLAELSPTGIYRLFGIPLGRLTHLNHDWFDLFDAKTANDMTAGLLAATNKEERKAALDELFRKHMADARPRVPYVDDAVDLIDQEYGRIKIAHLCEQLGVNERSLSRNFRHITGLSPKFYARAVQMNFVLGKMMEGDEKVLSRLALEYGFFDQSHFSRTMQEFFRQGPREYLESDNHMFNVFMGRKSGN